MTTHTTVIQERTLYLNDPIKNKSLKFMNNSISTTKYNLVNFFPKFLWEQFTRWANLFFLLTGLVQLLTDLSPTNRWGTIIPLSVVILVSAIKEIVEDFKRLRQDADVNNCLAKVLHGDSFQDIPWKKVEVGDIVRVNNGEFFPADLVLLSSSEPDALCYIETSNLDGETNLKIKQGLPETSHFISPEAVSHLNAVVKSELPNSSLYTFEGTIFFEKKDYPLNPDQLLLRGAQLRNTRWIYGVVVFTGHESKLLKNSTATPIKRTKVEHTVNTQIIFLFLILIVISVSCSFGSLDRQLNNPFESQILFFSTDYSQAIEKFGKNIVTYIILFNNLIPLRYSLLAKLKSLIVTMEVVKVLIGFFINRDLDMYYEVNDTSARARTSSLVEELGQVDYVFSDKTGTLTCNMMKFQRCTIEKMAYSLLSEDKKPTADESGYSITYSDMSQLLENWKKQGENSFHHEFLILLAVCHTVIPETDDSGNIIYQASSPDEAALVNAARDLGFIFHTRKPKSVIIRVQEQDLEYQILNVCEFNSTRKRMSCVVRTPNGSIKLYTKGADTVILERLRKNQNDVLDITCKLLEDFATEGLRTLCLAYRDISQEEYSRWSKIYDEAARTINNRGEELDKAAELIEKDLTLLGSTAIEDKLQDGVPDTIHTLMEAGIKVWVLTGDRQETAINIGYSCRLITAEMNLIVCNEVNKTDTKNFLEASLANVKQTLGVGTSLVSKKKLKHFFFPKSRKAFGKDFEVDAASMALIIDGKSLGFALEEDLKLIFLELALLCKAVVCCRVSPIQKALVVKLVKDNVEESVTLAIGDGANDVSMIQSAQVGVGISGLEGLQAARNADFSISQFRFLRKLLLVHGGWAYSRMSKIILLCFYKNITLYMIQLWYATQNGYSGATLFETWSSVSSYNVLWTVAQPFAIGLFDQYASARILDRYPPLYRLGQKSIFYNHGVFWAWISTSFVQSAILFFIWALIVGESTVLIDGKAIDNWVFGIMIYTSDLLTVMLKACLVVDTWVFITMLAVFGSFFMYFVLFLPYTIVGPLTKWSPELFNVLAPSFATPVFWCGIFLVPVIAIFRDFTWKYIKRNYYPKSYHIAQEIYKYNIPDYRPRQEWFRKAVTKVRQIQRLKKIRGYAFSQNETGQNKLIRAYDTTRAKPLG